MGVKGEMNLNIIDKDGYKVIFVSGPINAINSPKLREAIAKAYKQKIKGLICDIGEVEYMDSSGLATMVEGIQLAESQNLQFLLTRMNNERVKHLLEITRLTDLFPNFDSAEKAIEHLEASS